MILMFSQFILTIQINWIQIYPPLHWISDVCVSSSRYIPFNLVVYSIKTRNRKQLSVAQKSLRMEQCEWLNAGNWSVTMYFTVFIISNLLFFSSFLSFKKVFSLILYCFQNSNDEYYIKWMKFCLLFFKYLVKELSFLFTITPSLCDGNDRNGKRVYCRPWKWRFLIEYFNRIHCQLERAIHK